MPVENQPAANNTPEPATQAPAQQPSTPNLQDQFSQALAETNNSAAAGASNPPPANDSSPPAASAATVQVPASVNFRELASKQGIPVDQFKNDQELFDALFNERRQLAPLANMARQYAPHAAEIQQFLAERQQKAQQDAPAQAADPNAFDRKKHFAEKWGAPAWDPQWDFFVNKGMLQTDEETGAIVAVPGYEALVAPHLEKLNDAIEKQQRQHQALFRGNPFETIFEAMEPAFDRMLEERIQSYFGQQQSRQQQQTEMERFEQQFASQLFDQQGNPTQVGQRLGHLVGQMVGPDLDNPRMPAHEAYFLAAEAMGLTAQAPAPAAAAQAPVAPTPAQASANKVESFLDGARRNAAAAANSAPYSPITSNPNAPVTVGGELIDAWKQAAAEAVATN